MDVKPIVAVLFAAAPLAACGSTGANYEPIVDGPTGHAYYRDLSACRSLAEQRRYLDDETKLNAAIGAAAGGLIGAVSADDGDEGEGAIAGAVIGGLAGTATGASDAHAHRKQIVINCMSGRGHRVVG